MADWKHSLHGGHSGQYCNHAQGNLDEFVKAAEEKGFHTFAFTEHAPRYEEKFLYEDEVTKGWDIARLDKNFSAYAKESLELQKNYSGPVSLLRGFETEILPSGSYPQLMLSLKEEHEFDFMVGSVHFVHEEQIDGTMEQFQKALNSCGSLEDLCVEYYLDLQQMIEALRPEVIGHFDVIRKLGQKLGPVDTDRIKKVAEGCLYSAHHMGCLLDLNVSPVRNQNSNPYPAEWVIDMAKSLDIPFCLGDDSHAPDQVGVGLEEGRNYLLKNGVKEVSFLSLKDGKLKRITKEL